MGYNRSFKPQDRNFKCKENYSNNFIEQTQQKTSIHYIPKVQKESQPQIKQQQSKQQVQIIPQARFCWPSIKMDSVGVQISCTQKPLYLYKNTDILVIPFINNDFGLYGGNVIFRSFFNYSQKVMKKQMQPGDCYFQKVIQGQKQVKQQGNHLDFKTSAFIRLDENDTTNTLAKGLQNMAKILRKNQQIKRQKIVIPIQITARQEQSI